MASLFRSLRLIILLAAALALVGCGTTQHYARGGGKPVGRAAQKAKPPAASKVRRYVDNGFNYIDIPNLAGYQGNPPRRGGQMALAAAMPVQPAPGPSYEQALAPLPAHAQPLAISGASATYHAAGNGVRSSAIPEGGVDMDALLGVGAPSSSAPGVAAHGGADNRVRFTIAEGQSQQPVVAGIGLDEPLVLVPQGAVQRAP